MVTDYSHLRWMQPTHDVYLCANKSYHWEFVQCCRAVYKETYKRDLFTLDVTYRWDLFMCKQIISLRIRTVLLRFLGRDLQKGHIYVRCDIQMRPIYVQTDYITENSYSAAAFSTKRPTKETYLHWRRPTHQTYSCENIPYHREFVQCCRVFYNETYKRDLCTLNVTYTWDLFMRKHIISPTFRTVLLRFLGRDLQKGHIYIWCDIQMRPLHVKTDCILWKQIIIYNLSSTQPPTTTTWTDETSSCGNRLYPVKTDYMFSRWYNI